MAYIYAQDNYIIAFDDTDYFQLAKKDARFSENAESFTVFEKGIPGGEVIIPVADIGTWGTDTTMASFWALATLQVFLTKNTGDPSYDDVYSGELGRTLQALLVAATPTTVYTVPANTTFKTNTITVCNQSSGIRAFSMWIAVAGAADTPAQYIYFNHSIPKEDTFEIALVFNLNATDLIRFSASGTGMSVNINGIETT